MNPVVANQTNSAANHTPPATENREALLRQIMEHDFVAFDLNLYLNTHPTDVEALRRHREAVEASNSRKAQYQQMYGPLTASAADNKNRWTWSENPWPWMKM